MNYWIYFSLQTIGGLILLWKALPAYRDVFSGSWTPLPELTFWPFLIIGLLQVPYWLARTTKPYFKNHGIAEVLVGHFLLFLGRMMFVFVGGVFAALFYLQMTELRHTPFRMTLIVALLFSMFCYTQELEKLARLLIQNEATPKA